MCLFASQQLFIGGGIGSIAADQQMLAQPPAIAGLRNGAASVRDFLLFAFCIEIVLGGFVRIEFVQQRVYFLRVKTGERTSKAEASNSAMREASLLSSQSPWILLRAMFSAFSR